MDLRCFERLFKLLGFYFQIDLKEMVGFSISRLKTQSRNGEVSAVATYDISKDDFLATRRLCRTAPAKAASSPAASPGRRASERRRPFEPAASKKRVHLRTFPQRDGPIKSVLDQHAVKKP